MMYAYQFNKNQKLYCVLLFSVSVQYNLLQRKEQKVHTTVTSRSGRLLLAELGLLLKIYFKPHYLPYQRIKYGIVLIIRRSLTRLKAHKMQSPAKGKRELKSLYRSLSARNRSNNQSCGFSWLRSSQSNVLLATITNCHYLCCR